MKYFDRIVEKASNKVYRLFKKDKYLFISSEMDIVCNIYKCLKKILPNKYVVATEWPVKDKFRYQKHDIVIFKKKSVFKRPHKYYGINYDSKYIYVAIEVKTSWGTTRIKPALKQIDKYWVKSKPKPKYYYLFFVDFPENGTPITPKNIKTISEYKHIKVFYLFKNKYNKNKSIIHKYNF